MFYVEMRFPHKTIYGVCVEPRKGSEKPIPLFDADISRCPDGAPHCSITVRVSEQLE